MKYLQYLAVFVLTAVACAQPSGRFELLGKYRGLGGLVATTVAPGPAPGTQRLYASYLYFNKTIDVVAINPETGATKVYRNPAPGEFGARNITVGPDGNVYLGTLPSAHFLKLDRRLGKLIDLGRPSPSEQYIWDVTFGSDKRLYGVTYPSCKLVRYDPATGRLEDLGRMDPTEQYGRWVVGSSDGFIYIGIGTSKANIAAYNIRTGQHREILPADAQSVGTAKVYRGEDGKLYGSIGERLFQLDGWTAKPVESGHTVLAAKPDVLRDGRTVRLSESGGTLIITDPRTHSQVVRKVSYEGDELPLYRIGLAPDGGIYGSAILPIHFVRVDVNSHHISQIGNLGGGEVYSFLSYNKRLLMGAYAGLAPLMSYAPGLPFHPTVQSGNPTLTDFAGADESWRPQAMIKGPGGNVYIGAVAGYGKLEEPLVEWNVKNNSVQLNGGIVHDQSIISLASWRNFIIGGTTTEGGGGSHSTQKEARVFIWDATTRKRTFDIVPVPGASCMTDLITAPNGQVYGIAADTMFAFDPETRRITANQKLPFAGIIYNSVAVGKDGKIWGLAADGIFTIDPRTNAVALVARSPQKITGGFGLRNGAIYFISGSAVYRYKM